MSNKLNVERTKGGTWVVRSERESQRPASVFKSKADAVLSARSQASVGRVVVHTSTGQMLRPPVVKPTKAPRLMREAVLEVIRSEKAAKQKERSKT